MKWPFSGDAGKDSAMHVHISGLLGDSSLWVNIIILLRRWSWKSNLSGTLGKTLLYMFIVQKPLSLCDSFCGRWSWKPIIGDVWEDSGLHIHCWGLPDHSALWVVELMCEYGLEMAICWQHWRRLHSHWWFMSWSWILSLCVQLDRVPLPQGGTLSLYYNMFFFMKIIHAVYNGIERWELICNLKKKRTPHTEETLMTRLKIVLKKIVFYHFGRIQGSSKESWKLNKGP